MHLYTPRLHLRPLNIADAAELFNWYQHPDYHRFTTIGKPESVKEVRQILEDFFMNNNQQYPTDYWWILTQKKGASIGEIGLKISHKNRRSGNIFFALCPQFWRNGYALEAVETVCNYAFIDLELRTICAEVATQNHRSVRLLERIGMVRNGTQKMLLPIRGAYWDNHFYMLEEERFYAHLLV